MTGKEAKDLVVVIVSGVLVIVGVIFLAAVLWKGIFG